MRVLARFCLAATDPGQFPVPRLPEIAFLGRSNVGKSSVINSLLRTKIARTSSLPGRTRSINFYEVRWPGNPQPELVFADLPGYGYARVSREISQQWPRFIEAYLQARPTLALCLALVDVNLSPQASDLLLLNFLAQNARPTVLVATKSDRLSGNQLKNSLRALSEEYPEIRILPYSARTGVGRDEVWREIAAAVAPYRNQQPARGFG
jgi:GTP-binding protein